MKIKVEVLGELRVFRNGQEISLPPSKKTRALLGYLAVVDRPQRRERLCEIFWEIPDDPRGALRWSLSKIRQIAGENCVRADRNTVFFEPGQFDCDYRLISGLKPEALGGLNLSDIEAIADAYRGNFLEDLYLPNCPEFEAWRVAHVEDAELLCLRALRLLIDRTQNDPGRALRYAHMLHMLSPEDTRLNEEIRRLALTARESVAAPSPEPLLEGTRTGEAESRSAIIQSGQGNDTEANAVPASISDQTRRLISVLAAEIMTTRQAVEEDDPEAGLPIADALIAFACEEVEKHGGKVTSRSGASIIGIFGASAAAEDHALRACRAALALKMALREQSEQAHAQLCIGLDSGEAIVRPVDTGGAMQFDTLGPVVPNARRLAQSLQRGAIACTSRMNYAVDGHMTSLKLTDADFAVPLAGGQAYEIIEEKKNISRWELRRARGLTPLIGRRQEMQRLSDICRLAKAGVGQAVGVVAEAGFGKSRLIHEFLSTEARSGCRIFECDALESDSSSSFLAIKKLLRAIFRIEESDGAEAAQAKVSGFLDAFGAQGGIEPGLLFVLDLPVGDDGWKILPAQKRVRRVRNSVMGLLELMSRQTPLIILVEDLHWADTDSVMVLTRLIDGLSAQRILLVTSFRPEYRHQWDAKNGFTQLHLAALDATHIRSLLVAMLGNDASVSTLVSMIAERTDGVPLFAEETVQALVQTGALKGSPGDYVASGEITSLRVPATVQTVIAARIDRLAPSDRWLLQNAAIIGREVSLDLLASVAGLDQGAVAEGLGRLQDAGFVYEMQLLPIQIFMFKHALVQKVAYESIVGTDRKKLHAKLIDTIEIHLPHLVDDNVERLSEHAIEAERWDKAESYLLRSAGRALQRSSHNLAISFLKKGLDILNKRPCSLDRDRVEIEYQKLMGVAWMAAKGWGAEEVYTAYERVEALSEALADDLERFTALRGRAQYYMISGQPRAAQEIGHKFEGMKQLLGDTGRMIETHHVYWTNNFFMGNCGEAAKHAEEAIRLYDADKHHSLTYKYSGHDPGVCSRCVSGLAAWQQGDLGVAFERCHAALDLAQRFSHPLTMALAYWGLSYLHIFRREPEAVLKWAELEVTICDEFMMPLLHSQGLFQGGWALAQLGDRTSGIQQMQRGVEAIRATGAEMGLPYFLGLLAEAVAGAGERGRALVMIEEATAAADRHGSHFQMSELLRIKAEILAELKDHSADEVDALLLQAINLAESQGASLLALRAATSMAQLLARRKRKRRAAAVLAPYAGLITALAGTSEAKAASQFMSPNI
jgi:class 3 adenylate cyclase